MLWVFMVGMDLPGTDYASARTTPCSSGGPGSYLASGEMDEEDLKVSVFPACFEEIVDWVANASVFDVLIN